MTAKLIPLLRDGYSGKPVTEIIVNGFFTVDDHWKVLTWNKSAENILGVAASEITGKNIWEKFMGVIPVDFYTVYHRAFIQDTPIHFEEYWAEMGAWFDIITYYYDGILSVSFKSSNRRTYAPDPEQQLRPMNELYRLVTQVTNDCLWEWNIKTREVFWIDGGHKRHFGYQIENALIPQSFWENRMHPDDRVRILAGLDKVLTEGSAHMWEDEYRFEKADGTYAYVHDRGFIVYDEDKTASRMIGATQDITDRKLVELQLVEERRFIRQELHDNLNQILVAAKLYLEIAKWNEEDKVSYLERSADYITEVIRGIRKISHDLYPLEESL